MRKEGVLLLGDIQTCKTFFKTFLPCFIAISQFLLLKFWDTNCLIRHPIHIPIPSILSLFPFFYVLPFITTPLPHLHILPSKSLFNLEVYISFPFLVLILLEWFEYVIQDPNDQPRRLHSRGFRACRFIRNPRF